jgi:predicted esterase
MKKILLLIIYTVGSNLCLSQTFDSNVISNSGLTEFTNYIRNNKKIDAIKAISKLSSFNNYPKIDKLGIEYLIFYSDSIFGEIPVRVYVPTNYKNTSKNPAILLLHGAEGASRFSNVDKKMMKYVPKDTIDYTNDVFVNILKNDNNYLLIRPIADVTKDFRWAVNRSKYSSNPSIKTLSNIVIFLKSFLNIDDNRIYSWGHSDGSDGTFALDVLSPSIFAGFVGYNSMLTQIRGQVYLRNMKNKPFYLVHSDLDDLRPIQQTRLQIKALDSLKVPITYKEYFGYKHEDKHLSLDSQNSKLFIQNIVRNPYPKTLFWESDNSIFNQIDWLKIKLLKVEDEREIWQSNLNQKSYDRINKKYFDFDYYSYKAKSGAVIAEYSNNTFRIKTSRVEEIELLISPAMVDLKKPIIVLINGKIMFDKKIEADKNYILNEFTSSHDRKCFWVNSVILKTK